MSPLEIEILMHYASKAGDYRDGDHSSEAVRRCIGVFLDRGLLERREGNPCYRATEGTHMYVDALCEVPLPVQKLTWVMP